MPDPPDSAELAEFYRAEWGRLLSALIRDFHDFDLAEEALQDAFASALIEWGKERPENPRSWLYTAARYNALDQKRRQARFSKKRREFAKHWSEEMAVAHDAAREGEVPDERLRLIFTCCHPALASEARVAMTLREVCGFTPDEIARAFLVPRMTMAKRLVRAKSKIRGANIPFEVPSAQELPERLTEVMAVIYLVFNEGYAAVQGQNLIREDLCSEAIRLARLIQEQLSDPQPELDALLALMLLHDSRRAARVDEQGEFVLLDHQNRAKWDREKIKEGIRLVKNVLRSGSPGPYALEAAIAAVHAEAARHSDTDWTQIVGLYHRLYAILPSPVVGLNRAIAISMAEGPGAALPLVDSLGKQLSKYHYWHSTRGDLFRRLGRREEALASYRKAQLLAQNAVEQRFLNRRIAELSAE